MTTLTVMPKYEVYKDSGGEWIGEIPIHWELKKLKFISFINKQSLPENTSRNLTLEYVDIGSVTLEKGIEKVESFSFSDAPSRARRMANEGDTVVSTVRTYLKAIAYVDDISSKYIYSTGFAVITPKCLKFSKYLTSFIKSDAFTKQVDDVAKGMSYPAINSTDLSNLFIAEPPESEHIAIANFLDEKTAKIDEAIAIKEQQIELLKERKQIIIQHAVTQGLDPTVPMKDSGVEWIGKIPAHWEVKKIKFIFDKVRTGTTPSTANQNYFDGEINWFGPKDMNSSTLIFSERKISELAIKKGEAFLFPADSVLVVGIGATSGKTSYLNEAASFNQQVTGFHSEQIVNKYMYYVISSMSMMMLGLANYTTLPILNNEFFKNFILPVPSNAEQIDIINFIESEFVSINKMSMYLDMQIEKLKEYKTTLINSAVTGKIKVV